MTTWELLSKFLRLDIKLRVEGKRLHDNAARGGVTPHIRTISWKYFSDLHQQVIINRLAYEYMGVRRLFIGMAA